MFESLKAPSRTCFTVRVAPGDRRAAIYSMKSALVSAKLGVEDLREGVEITRRKLNIEREQLETVQRRKALAEGINDAETIALAVKYEQQHGDHVNVLERKLEVQEAEAELAERELAEMMSRAQVGERGRRIEYRSDRSAPRRNQRRRTRPAQRHKAQRRIRQSRAGGKRSAADADAEAKLAELKKKMGQ